MSDRRTARDSREPERTRTVDHLPTDDPFSCTASSLLSSTSASSCYDCWWRVCAHPALALLVTPVCRKIVKTMKHQHPEIADDRKARMSVCATFSEHGDGLRVRPSVLFTSSHLNSPCRNVL